MTRLARHRRRREESGQVTVMVVLFSICVLLAVIAVTDVSASYLRRQAATSLADGAALAATEAAAASGIYGAEQDAFVPIEQQAAALAVEQYLRDTGSYSAYPGLRADVRVVADRVQVSLTMPYELPVPLPGVAATTTIHAAGSASLPIY